MDTEKELLRFEQDWNDAIVRNDAAAIAGFMSDDWVIVGSDGVTCRSSFLEHIRSGDLIHSRMDADESRVKVYGDTGIVTSRGISAGTYKGQPFEFYEWSASVYVRKDGKWLCVHTMLTPAQGDNVL